MLSLARGSTQRVVAAVKTSSCIPVQTRSLQNTGVVRAASTTSSVPLPADAWRKGKVPVREDHGLYAFFRRKPDANLTGEDAYETVESAQKEVSGKVVLTSALR